jgi:hypothetical protein
MGAFIFFTVVFSISARPSIIELSIFLTIKVNLFAVRLPSINPDVSVRVIGVLVDRRDRATVRESLG